MPKKPYGHTAYTRRSKSGKLTQVKAKGAKPTEKKAPRRTRVLSPEFLKSQFGIDVDGSNPVAVASVVDALRGIDKVLVLDKKHACKVRATDIYDGWNAVYKREDNEIHIDNKRGHYSFNHEFGHLVDYRALVDPNEFTDAIEQIRDVIRGTSLNDIYNHTYEMDVREVGALEAVKSVKAAQKQAAAIKDITWVEQDQRDACGRVLDIIDPILKKYNAVVEWNEAVDKSKQMKELKKWSAYQTIAHERQINMSEASKYAQYLREPTEVFARYFEQWCAVRLHEKGENPINYKAYEPGPHADSFEYHEQDDFAKLRPAFEKMIGPKLLKSLQKALVLQMVCKAKTPYGHTAYTRTSKKTGKLTQVKAKGVKPTEAKAAKKASAKKLSVESLKRDYGIVVKNRSRSKAATNSVIEVIENLNEVFALDSSHQCTVEIAEIYTGSNASYKPEPNTILIDRKHGRQSFTHEFGHLLDYQVLGDKQSAQEFALNCAWGDRDPFKRGLITAIDAALSEKELLQGSYVTAGEKKRKGKYVKAAIRKNKPVVDWLRAVEKTQHHKDLLNGTAASYLVIDRKNSPEWAERHARYLRRPTEVFARYFEQWCAVRLAEKRKSESVELREKHKYWYFSDTEFAKLRPLFEKMIGPKLLKSLEKALVLQTLNKSLDRFAITAMTSTGKVKPVGEGKFGARQVVFGNGLKACLKPALHSNMRFRGIPENTQHFREVAASQLDYQLLHFDVVQPALLTMYKGQQASIALWCSGKFAKELVPNVFNRKLDDWKDRAALFAAKIDTKQLRKVVLFDLVVNNTDRHAKNCLFSPLTGRVWAIDHGLTFGRNFRYYYNVFHRFLFRHNLTLTEEERRRLEDITREQLLKTLQRYLKPKDIENTYQRIQWMLVQKDLGFEAIADGRDGKDDFPSYSDWFKQRMDPEPQGKIVSHIERMGAQAPLVIA